MNESRIILNLLLDKYEQSLHFREPGRSNRRVLIKTSENGIPEYDYQNAATRDAFNTAINNLVQKDVVHVEWLPGRKQLVFKEIWLNLRCLEQAYMLAGRQSLHSQIDEYCALLEASNKRVNIPWIKAFLASQVDKLRNTTRFPGLFKKGPAHLLDALQALEQYDQLEGDGMTMRTFSIVCYHDSKFFEKNIRDDFLAIAREYHQSLAELLVDQELSERDQLDYLGIYAHPEIYEFAGPISIETEEGLCDCSPFSRYGCAMLSTVVHGIRKLHMDNIDRIMLIENKTNYEVYIERARCQNELVIYHGGFLSPQKKKLLRQIFSDCPERAEVFFWADIDLGGFKMFAQLKNLTPNLVPWKMGAVDVDRYFVLGQKRNERYMKELESFLLLQDNTLFSDSIHALLHYNITIEQEVMLSDL